MTMRTKEYLDRFTFEQWRALSYNARRLLASRAKSDLLQLWKSCGRKRCRRARSCSGDADKCLQRPWLADLQDPDFGRPDYRFKFNLPRKLRKQWNQLEGLAGR
jgi:hypothetical protein